jgi:tetratricopeptide (TPR) repeat protein/pimeloyl-ACP methyl ester carboxylesterase
VAHDPTGPEGPVAHNFLFDDPILREARMLADLESREVAQAEADRRAIEVAETSLQLVEQKFGHSNEQVIAPLIALGDLLRGQGNRERARAIYLRALDISDKPGLQTIELYEGLTSIARSASSYAEAEKLGTKLFDAFQDFHALPDKCTDRYKARLHRRRIGILIELIDTIERQNRLPDTEVFISKLLPLLGDDKFENGSEYSELRSLNLEIERAHYGKLADIKRRACNYDDALLFLNLELKLATVLRDPQKVVMALSRIADVQRQKGADGPAEEYLWQAASVAIEKIGRSSLTASQATRDLKKFYDVRGRLSDTGVLAPAPIFFASNRRCTNGVFDSEIEYSVDRFTYGTVRYRIPLDNLVGPPSSAEGAIHLERVNVTQLGGQLILEAKERCAKATKFPNQALVFVHGYNNTFDDAISRAAAIAHTIGFDGLVAAFAWPATSSYVRDLDTAELSADCFGALLKQLSQHFPDVTLHVVAHSMGAKLSLAALPRVIEDTSLKIGRIILAHADVSTDRLKHAMEILRRRALTITSYFSRGDLALHGSNSIRFTDDRVGTKPVYLAGVDNIDISALEGIVTSNHAVFVRNPVILHHIATLISPSSKAPDDRTAAFAKIVTAEGIHWQYKQQP